MRGDSRDSIPGYIFRAHKPSQSQLNPRCTHLPSLRFRCALEGKTRIAALVSQRPLAAQTQPPMPVRVPQSAVLTIPLVIGAGDMHVPCRSYGFPIRFTGRNCTNRSCPTIEAPQSGRSPRCPTAGPGERNGNTDACESVKMSA